jgi:hypothetical protein
VKYHGGKRDGAGRHQVTHKKKRCNVTLAPDVLEILETLCNGNRSAAIEFVSRHWRSLTPRALDECHSCGAKLTPNNPWCQHCGTHQ